MHNGSNGSGGSEQITAEPLIVPTDDAGRVQADLRERMVSTFGATLRLPGPSLAHPPANPRLKERVDLISGLAPLYFKQHVPFWPPRLLLRKMIRKMLYPVLGPQVAYNEAVRDCALELRAVLEYESEMTRNAAQKIIALEEKVEMLEAQLRHLAAPPPLSSPYVAVAENAAARMGKAE